MMLTCPIPPAAPATTVHLFVSKLSQGGRGVFVGNPAPALTILTVLCVCCLMSGYKRLVSSEE
jgi:hypothetical protein